MSDQLPASVWDTIGRAKLAQDADVAIKFTCQCGWITNAVVHDIAQPVAVYLPPGWEPGMVGVKCPDCAGGQR